MSFRPRLAIHETWEPLIAKPKLTSARWSTDYFLLATLELVDIPASKNDLISEEIRFGGGNPDKEIGRKRDCKETTKLATSH